MSEYESCYSAYTEDLTHSNSCLPPLYTTHPNEDATVDRVVPPRVVAFHPFTLLTLMKILLLTGQ